MATSTAVSPFRLTTRQLVCNTRSSNCGCLSFRFGFRSPSLVACTSSSAETEQKATSASEERIESQGSESEEVVTERIESAETEDEAEAATGTDEGEVETGDEENLKLERGPSVEEAKQMAKYVGQVEAFAAPYRTKRWALTRNKGAQIADLMIMYGGLLDRGVGSGQIMAAAGAVVIEKIKKDANKLLGEDDVKEQDVYELLRAIQLLEMELQLVKVAKKGEKLFERLEKAKEHCKLAFKIASRI